MTSLTNLTSFLLMSTLPRFSMMFHFIYLTHHRHIPLFRVIILWLITYPRRKCKVLYQTNSLHLSWLPQILSICLLNNILINIHSHIMSSQTWSINEISFTLDRNMITFHWDFSFTIFCIITCLCLSSHRSFLKSLTWWTSISLTS